MTECIKTDDYIVVKWKPPDLSPGSPWTQETIQELRNASKFYDDHHAVFTDGMERLARHQQNYDADGPNPTHLQLLWWEFPPERLEELRLGCSMNFLRDPIQIITPNSKMTPEQVEIEEEFIVELVSLGVLLEVDYEYVKTDAPLSACPNRVSPVNGEFLRT
jgi:hypothetical protein